MSTHTGISTVAFAMALSLAAAGPVPPGLAQVAPAPSQTEQDHDAHHPGANAEVPPAATPAPAPTQTTRSPMAIMGLGGPPGIMGDMRQMMRNTMTMMSSNVEGRIATLKTELKITDAQAPQWDRFADALRSAAKSMNGMSAQMMETGTMGTLPARLERDEKMLSAHLNSLKTLKDAAEPFYAALSDEQKKVVDGLMIGPMGVM